MFVAGTDLFVPHEPSTLELRSYIILLSELPKSKHCYYSTCHNVVCKLQQVVLIFVLTCRRLDLAACRVSSHDHGDLSCTAVQEGGSSRSCRLDTASWHMNYCAASWYTCSSTFCEVERSLHLFDVPPLATFLFFTISLSVSVSSEWSSWFDYQTCEELFEIQGVGTSLAMLAGNVFLSTCDIYCKVFTFVAFLGTVILFFISKWFFYRDGERVMC
jgi:hypothetical protein